MEELRRTTWLLAGIGGITYGLTMVYLLVRSADWSGTMLFGYYAIIWTGLGVLFVCRSRSIRPVG